MRRCVAGQALLVAGDPRGSDRGRRSRPAPPANPQPVTAIKAGRLIDPETGTRRRRTRSSSSRASKIKAVGPGLPIPAGAAVIDLSKMTVLPGLVDAHTHIALTYKEQPENNYYYLTYVMESTPLRAIQAASNGIQLLNSGFTVVRDVGNNALYADTALRQAIEQGWLPGPTVIPSGPMIGSTGGQFWPTPEMYKYHNIVYPEYIDAEQPATRSSRPCARTCCSARSTIKLCIDCKPWGYSVDDIKLAIREAAKGGCKVEGHVQTPEGAQRAIDAGIYIIAHGNALTAEHHRQMAEKGIFLAGTDTPFTTYRGTEAAFKRTVANLRDAWEKKVSAHLLDRLRLLERPDEGREDRRVAHPRRADDQLPHDLEGREHPAGRHPAGDDDQRLQGRGRHQGARADQAGLLRRPDRRAGQSARPTSTRCATSSS